MFILWSPARRSRYLKATLLKVVQVHRALGATHAWRNSTGLETGTKGRASQHSNVFSFLCLACGSVLKPIFLAFSPPFRGIKGIQSGSKASTSCIS